MKKDKNPVIGLIAIVLIIFGFVFICIHPLTGALIIVSGIFLLVYALITGNLTMFG